MMNEKVIDFIKSNWKEIVIGILVIFLIAVGYYEYKKYETVPMTTIKENTIPEVTDAIDKLGIGDKVTPKELKNSIDKANQSAPQKTFITSTQKEADSQANTIAKTDKADAVIKQTQATTSNSGIVNNYYGLHLEKNNKIKAGITVVDNKVYENIGYQHKKDEVILHMQLGNSQPIKGVTYMRTIAEW